MKMWRKELSRLLGKGLGDDRISFHGDYQSWEEASAHSTGYDAAVILEKTRAALMKVRDGEAAYERDSVLFDRIQHSFPVLAGLLRAAQARGGRLCVVDFGGSLGTVYFQSREFLAPVKSLEWLVIEQPSYVACGRKDFESEQLHFYTTIGECASGREPDVLLFSSVLQYLPRPYQTLEELLGRGIPHVIIDRTPFLTGDRDRLTVQRVPDNIYPASYPAWFFSESRLTAVLSSAGYSLVADFPGADDYSPEGDKAVFKGFIFERRKA